jgi:Protein of unknown function (DUF2844)
MKALFTRSIPFTSWLMVGIGWLGLSCPALAALGGDVTSVEADRAHLKATSLEVKPAEAYQVHPIQAPGGTVISEYVSSTGRVFAVSWRGPFIPEMQQILGSYFQQYSAALGAKRPYGRRPLNIQEPGLVVQTGGHMGAYFGRAYLPEMLPASLKADEIK